MAKRNFDHLVAKVRLDRKQRALQDALLVPWRQVEESAEDYVECHTFVLWVRTVVESTGQISEAVRSELRARCPGFVDANESTKHQPIWKRLEDWIAAEVFAHAKAGGWFSAVLYYAHKDLRIEQAWTFRERAKAG